MTRALLLLVVMAAPASADDSKLPPYKPGKPDPAAVKAGEESNLVSNAPRSGFAFAGALGPALQIGVNIDEKGVTGTGGGFSFRLGRVANPDTIIWLEVCGTVFPDQFDEIGPSGTPVTKTAYNQSGLLTLGGQTYVASSLWLRAGAGLASFTSRTAGETRRDTVVGYGGGVVGGAGLDFLRRRSVALGLELLTTGAIYRDGLIFGVGFTLGLSIY